MFRTISTRLSVSFVAFFLLTVVSGVASYTFTRDLPHDELALHSAMRAQALVAKTSRNTVVFAKLKDAAARLQQRDAVLEDVRAFETTLRALREGGAVPLDGAMTKMKEIRAVSDPTAAEQLALASQLWTPYVEYVRRVIDSDGDDTSALVNALVRDAELSESLANASTALREQAAQKHAAVNGIQLGALALGGVFLVFVLWATSRHVHRPLRRLVSAAESISTGAIDTPVEVEGPLEIEELAESFERMRVSVRAVLEASVGADELDELDDL